MIPKTEQEKSDIHYKNENPKLSMKAKHPKYKPTGAGSTTTESVKRDPAAHPAIKTLKKKTGASAKPMTGGATRLEDRVSTSNTKGVKKLSLEQNASAKSNPEGTKPTWNTRTTTKKARRYA